MDHSSSPQSTSHNDIVDWSTVRRGQHVAFDHHSDGPVAGEVVLRTDDASTLWVQLNGGGGRRLIHCEDGYRLRHAG